MALQFLSATRQRIFNFVTGTNQLATIADVNTVMDTLNHTVFSNYMASMVYKLTETGGVAPITLTPFRVTGGSATIGAGCDCCSCISASDFDKCGASKGFACNDSNISMNRTAPGVYTLMISGANISTAAGVAVRFGNVATLGVIINLTKVSKTTYTVTAYDTQAGAPIDVALTDTILEVMIWG